MNTTNGAVVGLNSRAIVLGTHTTSTLGAVYTGSASGARLTAVFGSSSNPVTGSGNIAVGGSTTALSAIEFDGANTYTGTTTVGLGQTLLLGTGGSSSSSAMQFQGGTLSTVRTVETSTSLAAINRSVGGSLDVVLPSSGSITTTTANGTPTTLGGWATVNNGTAFAVSGTGSTAGAITALTNTTTAYTTTATAADFDAGSGGAFTATNSINSLRFNASAAATVGLRGVFTVASGGILVTPTVTGATVISGGTSLTSGNGTDLIVHQYNTAAPLRISRDIVCATGLTKVGSGTLILTNTNDYTGSTLVSNGTLQLGNGGGSGNIVNSSLLTIGTGSSVVHNRSTVGAGTPVISGAGTLVQAGTAGNQLAMSGNNNSGFTGTMQISSGQLEFTSSTNLGSTSAGLVIGAGQLHYNPAFDTSGTSTELVASRPVSVTDASSSINVLGSATLVDTLSISGAIGGTGTINKTGLGTL